MTDSINETTITDTSAPAWLIPDKVYDVLKWVGLVVLPALAVFVQTVGTAVGCPHLPNLDAPVVMPHGIA